MLVLLLVWKLNLFINHLKRFKDNNISSIINYRFKIPPAPPRPDFDSSREKLQKLGEGEGTMTKEEFLKMKKELES